MEIKTQVQKLASNFLFNNISGRILSLWWVTTLDTKQGPRVYLKCLLPGLKKKYYMNQEMGI